MGKRSKERRLAETAGRRKQTIQLGSISTRSGPNYGPEESYAPLRATKVSGIGLLGAYEEESDDDSGNDAPATVKPTQTLAAVCTREPVQKMEDQLAGFLAEINAIDGNTPAESETTRENIAVYDQFNFDPFTQGHLLPNPWQAVLDEGSGHHYYWNCETNEVQWEPPAAPTGQTDTLPEPPPPPAVVHGQDGTGEMGTEELKPEGPSVEEFEAIEEERRRKEMSAKLAGLSKKERIKLLLQRNNLIVEENPSEAVAEQHISDNTMEAESGNITELNTNDQLEAKTVKLSGLVMGYDSETSDSEAATPCNVGEAEDHGAVEAKMEAQENVVGRSMLSKEALADMDALFDEADVMIVNKDLRMDDSAEAVDVSDMPISITDEGKDENELDPVKKEEDEQEVIRKEEGISDVEEETQKDDMEESVNTSQCELGTEDKLVWKNSEEKERKEDLQEAALGGVNLLEQSDMVSSEKDDVEMKSFEGDTCEAIDEDKFDAKKKKEFAVDMFAEESGHETEEDVDKEEKDQEVVIDAKRDSGKGMEEEESREGGKSEEREKVAGGKVKDDKAEKKEVDERGKEDNKKGKRKEKKKEKKKEKDQREKRYKDGDRDSRRKRRSEKSEKKSKKKQSEKDKTRHRSKQDGKESRKKIELTEEEKLIVEEEKRKAVLEEIEREERLRSEYERLQKIEKERKEEEQKRLQLEVKKKEEMKKEEEKKKEEEMNDFAEMLLEGALDGDGPVPEPKEQKKTEAIEKIIDDMEISDNEGENIRPPLPPMPPPEDEPLIKGEDSQNAECGEKAYYQKQEEFHSRISDLSMLLFDKLEFLEVSRKGLTNFQVLFIEMETRLSDWREGALDTEYLLYKLEEIDAEICKYEGTAAPGGWSCHWSSEHGMYYYYQEETGESTWSYPGCSAAEQASQPGVVAGPQLPNDVTAPAAPTAPTAAPLDNYGYGRSNMMMWRSDLVENQKKDEDKVSANKSETKTSDPYRDPYRQTSKKQDARPASPDPAATVDTPLPPGEDEEPFTNPWNNSDGSSSPVHQAMTTATSSTVPSMASVANLKDDDGMSGATIFKAAAVSTIPRVASDSFLLASHPLQIQPSVTAVQSGVKLAPVKQEKKKKEKRKKLASGSLPSKKLKTVSSLVQKWQQVKQKVDEEMMENSSEDEDQNTVSQKRIEEWKRAQIESGRAAYNPNFEEIKGNWKEKIKKKQT